MSINPSIIAYGKTLLDVCRGTISRGQDVAPAAFFFPRQGNMHMMSAAGFNSKEDQVAAFIAVAERLQAETFMLLCESERLLGVKAENLRSLPRDKSVRELAELGYGAVERAVTVEIQTRDEDFALYMGVATIEDEVVFGPVEEVGRPGMKHQGAFHIL